MKWFEADDRCMCCNKLILTEHEIFMFNNSPDTIRIAEDRPEWQPCPDGGIIPFDNGPSRVAYVWNSSDGPTGNDHVGEAVVQVHEGADYLVDAVWVPCRAATLDAIPGVWLWICQPMSPKNPITNEWMLSISS